MGFRFKIGEIVYFQPVVAKADGGFADESATPCRVCGAQVVNGKVLYDLELPNGEGGFYEPYPIRCVDSYFVLANPDARPPASPSTGEPT